VRVLLVSSNFRPHVGGIERFTETLAEGLAARGHDVTVLCCRDGSAPLRERVDGFEVERVPATYVLDQRANVPVPLPSPRRLFTATRRLLTASDVVHVQDVLYATSLPALLLARRRRVPSVLTQHVAFVPQRSRLLDAVESAAYATLGRSARLATTVATLTPAVAEWAARQWALNDVRVLPIGVAVPNADERDRRALRESFGLSANRLVALFVGRDVPKKGLDVFLGAADPAYDLVAVTDRERKADRAVVLPFMSPERLQQLLHCVDAFVLPSEGEGFPITVQEALAAGLPVVTTSQPGYEHFVSPEDVLFVDRDAQAVRAALLRLAGDESLRARLAQRSRLVAERHFTADAMVEAYERLYEELRRL
jgi:glycosyltransferase involved in cell wall biosynthesis